MTNNLFMPNKVIPEAELDAYMLEVLALSGMENISEGNKAKFLPQLKDELKIRLGAALLPELNGESAEKFAKMMENDVASPEEWTAFWKEAVPTYDEILKNVLINFGRECKTMLSGS